MNILMITENDPAGMGIAFTNAINHHTEHSCRMITKTVMYNFHFEKDLHVPDLNHEGFEEIRQLLKEADILHFHILSDENIEIGPIKVKEFIKGKMIVHHHHGHPEFRAYPEKYQMKYRRLKRKVLVSTPDLLKLLPGAHWQPNLVPVNDSLFIPAPKLANNCIVVGQSVTRKDLKNTEDLLEVVDRINQEFSTAKVKADIIENTAYKECIKRKNKCHIIFDHMQGYYGVSSLESLSQGKPVIAGLDDWNKRCIRTFAESDDIPWVIAHNKKALKDKLTELLDEDLREQLGSISRNWMERCWNDQKVIRKLINFYNSLEG